MRSRSAFLASAYLAGVLIAAAPGCGGNGLERPTDPAKKVDPMNDMPGYKDMQDKLKAQPKKKGP